jgi:hypothetical protein
VSGDRVEWEPWWVLSSLGGEVYATEAGVQESD